MISRDQMVGPWQVPVADVAVSLSDLRGLYRRGHGDGRAHARGGAERPRVGTIGGGRGHHQHRRRRRAQARPMFGCRRIGWPPAASRERMPTCMPRCARWARNCAHRWGSPFPSARTRCPCGPSWTDADGMHTVTGAHIAHHLCVRARSGCAPHADPRTRCFATFAPAAGGSRRRQKSPGRFVLGAGTGTARRRAGGLGRSGAPAAFLRRDSRTEGSRPAARLPRPFGRRRAGDVVGNGLCRHCGLDIDLRSVADPIAACFSEELGAVLQVAAARADEAREVLAASRSWAAGARSGRADRRAMPSPWWQTVPWSIPRRASSCTADGAKCRSGCRRCATIRSAPARSIRGLLDAKDPGLHARLTYDPSGQCRGALHRPGRAARGRRAARTGREQPDRDGGRVHARRDSTPTMCT